MNPTRRRIALLAATTVTASAPALRAHDDENPPAIARTALIHGVAGPYPVAGYRMGEHALAALSLERGSLDLEVIHYSPTDLPLSAIIDGLQAATGASLGKRNLSRVDSTQSYSIVRHRKTGVSLRFHLHPDFLRRFTGLPQDKVYDAGAQVAELPPAEIFQVR
jgi:formylmethanofuran dehydrogenase subunit E